VCEVNWAEKAFVVFYWVYMLTYLCCVIVLAVTGTMDGLFLVVMPFHFFGMFLGIPLLFVVFRDIYKRDFPNPNTKVTWTILILLFWPSILVYLYKHGFRPRPVIRQRLEASQIVGTPAIVPETGNPYQSPGS
jgi:hypothetical protein